MDDYTQSQVKDITEGCFKQAKYPTFWKSKLRLLNPNRWHCCVRDIWWLFELKQIYVNKGPAILWGVGRVKNWKVKNIIMVNPFFAAFIYNEKDTFFRKFIFGVLVVGKCPRRVDWAIKKSHFNFVVEYPTWVSIKRYLRYFWKRSILNGFWTFSFKRMQ